MSPIVTISSGKEAERWKGQERNMRSFSNLRSDSSFHPINTDLVPYPHTANYVAEMVGLKSLNCAIKTRDQAPLSITSDLKRPSFDLNIKLYT